VAIKQSAKPINHFGMSEQRLLTRYITFVDPLNQIHGPHFKSPGTKAWKIAFAGQTFSSRLTAQSCKRRNNIRFRHPGPNTTPIRPNVLRLSFLPRA